MRSEMGTSMKINKANFCAGGLVCSATKSSARRKRSYGAWGGEALPLLATKSAPVVNEPLP
jgi:hypothetical protein